MTVISSVRAWIAGEVLTDSNMRTFLNDPIEDLAGRNGSIEFEDDLDPNDGTAYILPETSSGPNTSLAKNGDEQPIYFDGGGTAREVFDASNLWIPSGVVGDLPVIGDTDVAHQDSGDTRSLKAVARLPRPTTAGIQFLSNTSAGVLAWTASAGPKKAVSPMNMFANSTSTNVNMTALVAHARNSGLTVGTQFQNRIAKSIAKGALVVSLSGASKTFSETIALPYAGQYLVAVNTVATLTANVDGSSVADFTVSTDPRVIQIDLTDPTALSVAFVTSTITWFGIFAYFVDDPQITVPTW